jgi:hypothetical protein
MGKLQGISKAEEFRLLADSKHINKEIIIIGEIAQLAIEKAETTAQGGGYYCSIYDDRLSNFDVAKGIVKRLKRDGFTVEVNEDEEYSAHANKTMMRVVIGWVNG